MNPYNPYQAPQTNEATFGAGPNEGAHAAILAAMQRTRPWVMFFAILGFLGAGLMFLVGLLVMVAGAAATTLAKGGPFDKFTPLLGLVYIVLGAFYIVPSVLLWRFASSIGDYTRSGATPEALGTALDRQASFWRFTGIFTAVMIGLYFVVIFIAVIAGIAAGVSR